MTTSHRPGETTSYTKPSVADRYAGTRRKRVGGRGSRDSTGRARIHAGTQGGKIRKRKNNKKLKT